jgi:hypothetical protein
VEKVSFLPFFDCYRCVAEREIKLRTLLVYMLGQERRATSCTTPRAIAVGVACSLHWARDTNKAKMQEADSHAGVTLGVECGGTTGGNVHVPPPPTEGCTQGGLLSLHSERILWIREGVPPRRRRCRKDPRPSFAYVSALLAFAFSAALGFSAYSQPKTR